MTKIIDKNKSRQGRSGLNMLVVLIAALLLVLVVWAGVGMFGESIEPTDPVGGAPAEQPVDGQSAPQPSN